MPPKAKSVSSGKHAKSTIKVRPITKRPHRAAAVAAVRAVTQSLSTQRHVPSPHSASVESRRPSRSPCETLSSDELIKALELSNKVIIDSLNEVKELFEEFRTAMRTAPADRMTGTSSIETSGVAARIFEGITPAEAVQAYMPWLVDEKVVLTNVVSCTLDVAHLIKLIPPEQRPKGQANAGLATGVHIDTTTGKTSFVNESTVTYEKVFPDFQTLVNALTVYGVIRDLYDSDKLGVGCAIMLYIRQLAWWSKHHKSPSIMAYFIAHFRKHQPAVNPRVWFEVDIQLFTMYLTPDTITIKPVASKERTSLAVEICKNWNGSKGCTWDKCPRRHICLICKGDHTVLSCTKVSKSS